MEGNRARPIEMEGCNYGGKNSNTVEKASEEEESIENKIMTVSSRRA